MKLKPFYVYALIEDKNNSILYVGYGESNLSSHYLRTFKYRSVMKTVKQKKIHSEIKSRENITPIIIARFYTREEALAVESVLIHWVYGIECLANITRGNKTTSIRPKNHYEEIPGLDKP